MLIYSDAFGTSGFSSQTRLSYAMAEGVTLFLFLAGVSACSSGCSAGGRRRSTSMMPGAGSLQRSRHPSGTRPAVVQSVAPGRRRGGLARVMIVVCAFVLIPIVMVVLGSFKTVNEFFATPYGLPESFGLHNYRKAWTEANLQVALRNSIVSTALGVAISTTLACLAAYGLARFRFAGRLATRLLFVGGLVVPVQLIILPIFIMFRQIGILGDLRSLIAVYAVFGIPLGVLVLTGFFAALPRDLEEAARIDGASHFQIFWRIMLPLTRPALAAVVILNGVWMWNDFFLGFILLTNRTP